MPHILAQRIPFLRAFFHVFFLAPIRALRAHCRSARPKKGAELLPFRQHTSVIGARLAA
jgi:hypothetical protein